jgi:hypothetical protein
MPEPKYYSQSIIETQLWIFIPQNYAKTYLVWLIESFVEFSLVPKYVDAFVSYSVTIISWKDGQFDNKVNASACLR